MSRDFAYFTRHYDESMREMFAAVGDLYALYWGDFFHFAIFDDDNESWEEAFRKTHDGYMEAVRLRDARKVIELACGCGAFSNLIAQHAPGNVLGIDISPAQLSQACRFERDNLRFRQHDIMRLDELGETFDAVIFMDAACYLPDKAKALAKIYAIMNPGARFLLIDWCKEAGLNRVQEELVLHPFMRYWAVPNLKTMAWYERHLTREGFRILQMEDLNSKVGRNWDYGYERALSGVEELSLGDIARLARKGLRVGRRGLQLIKEHFPAAIYIKVGFDTGFLQYAYFLAEKPRDKAC
jgi:sterol 24-C-methyltransferase